MRFPTLLTADLHLTSNPRDEYRWGFFPWLRKTVKAEGVRSITILGDLSDAKDFHPSSLVNRIAWEIKETASALNGGHLYMIPGNHEWLKRGEEFWRFLNHVAPNVHYMVDPSDDPAMSSGPGAAGAVRFLPFTKNPARDWAGFDFGHYDFVFMHQTIKGARSSNGQEMDGEELPDLSAAGKVYSGDIHVPQVIGAVEYVGSPYHVHFGDSFKARCVLLLEAGSENLRFPTISRVTIDATADLEALVGWADKLKSGDQIKLRVHLEQSERHEWKKIRREAMSLLTGAGLSVHGIEMLSLNAGKQQRLGGREGARGSAPPSRPQDDVLRFVMAEELGSAALDTALEVIEK